MQIKKAALQAAAGSGSLPLPGLEGFLKREAFAYPTAGQGVVLGWYGTVLPAARPCPRWTKAVFFTPHPALSPADADRSHKSEAEEVGWESGAFSALSSLPCLFSPAYKWVSVFSYLPRGREDRAGAGGEREPQGSGGKKALSARFVSPSETLGEPSPHRAGAPLGLMQFCRSPPACTSLPNRQLKPRLIRPGI